MQGISHDSKLGYKGSLNSLNQYPELSEQFSRQLMTILTRWRWYFIVQQSVLFLPILLAITGINLYILLKLGVASLYVALATVAALILLSCIKALLITRGRRYKNITAAHLVLHLNRHFPQLEESAQLLICDEAQLSVLEKLQCARVLPFAVSLTSNQAVLLHRSLTPVFAKQTFYRHVFLSVLLVISAVLLVNFLWLDKQLATTKIANHHIDKQALITDGSVGTAIEILSKQVSIEPPAYSLATSHPNKSVASGRAESLNFSVLAGSKVSWLFKFNQANQEYFLNFSNGQRHRLQKMPDGSFGLEKTFSSSTVYHLSTLDTKQADAFSSVYSIKVIADAAPKVRIITPKATITEFTKNSLPKLTTKVQIYDDFAVTDVKILASISKGSGEGVKFRDQTFHFDHKEQVAGKFVYSKTWQLADLGMEPGDELYFSVSAKDNRMPAPQTTRSVTKIIRWLEEGQLGISADGILIDFMPEYFKSQRQIIIETIELIEDKLALTQDKFTEKSEILGVAQSELKEKYGQYLGDEFEGQHSVGVTFTDDHSQEQKPTIHVHDDHGGSNAVITENVASVEAAINEHTHQHNESEGLNESQDISGRMALINRYGHNHEDSDVGVMTSQDPKALMKKSLENMWQAELHLMLSDPELALPYEQKALKLLKQAKKAERIYVKRLGFEPPPVSEQRRYQGEQKDILADNITQSQFQKSQLSNQTQLAFKALLHLLYEHQSLILVKNNGLSSNAGAAKRLNSDDIFLVQQAKSALADMVEERPALISALASVERILLTESLDLPHCDNCVQQLMSKLEQLIPNAIAVPVYPSKNVVDKEPLMKSYSQFLKDNL